MALPPATSTMMTEYDDTYASVSIPDAMYTLTIILQTAFNYLPVHAETWYLWNQFLFPLLQ